MKRYITGSALLGSLLTSTLALAGPHDAGQTRMKNPHSDGGDCALCHVASKESLNSWFTFGSTKRALIADPVALCQKCHGVSFGHGVGKKPKINRAELPLDADNSINCALTCHDMHLAEPVDAKQGHFHLRLPISKLCISCHNK